MTNASYHSTTQLRTLLGKLLLSWGSNKTPKAINKKTSPQANSFLLTDFKFAIFHVVLFFLKSFSLNYSTLQKYSTEMDILNINIFYQQQKPTFFSSLTHFLQNYSDHFVNPPAALKAASTDRALMLTFLNCLPHCPGLKHDTHKPHALPETGLCGCCLQHPGIYMCQCCG